MQCLQTILFGLFLLFSVQSLHAQEVREIELTQDSTLIDEEQYPAISGKDKEGFFSMFEGNPGKAALYSALIPGGGQIYNKKYWKAPIVWGAHTIAILVIIDNHQSYLDFDNGYKGVLRGELDSYRGLTNAQSIRGYRDRFKQTRDYASLAIGIIHVLSIADAFVDRHLIEFDVDEDISLRLTPVGNGVSLAMRF